MKKLLAYLLTVIMLSSCVTGRGQDVDNVITKPEISQLEIGDYIQLGKYNDEPILWRYVADDQQGKLIVSDKILCFKTFGRTNLWEESFPHKWLNSTVPEGEVTWGDFDDHLWTIDNIDADEKGFLHESNFTSSQKSVLKTVTQQTMVPSDRLDLATNGNDKAYSAIKEYKPGGPKDGGYLYFYDISELSKVYSGASYEITDTMFLMDEMQVYQMWKNLGCVKALCAEKCIRPENYSDSEYRGYLLRTPSHVESLGSYYTTESVSYISMGGYYASISNDLPAGIRPAFYLDEANAVILSGSGTEDDPYVVDGKPEERIRVFYNGTEIEFDVAPIIENDRTLVPFRAIFEAMGASVEWEEATETVTGMLNETTIRLIIGSDTAYVNDKPITLDVASKLMNDRTLVPLRFVAENFGFKVDWNEADLRIDISSIN